MPETLDPGPAIKRLGERVAEEVAKAGPLTMRRFTFEANITGDGPHMIIAVFSIDGELIETEVDPAQAQIDRDNAEFERIMRGDQVATLADQEAEVRRALQERLAAGGGLLDDEDDEA